MKPIDDKNEVQFRQVHPNWVEEGEPSRLAFIPTTKDEDKLSLDRSANLNSKESFDNFRALGLQSEGVYGLTPNEFSEEPHSIECYESPLDGNPHHSHADFAGLSRREKKLKSLSLRRSALARGKLHPERFLDSSFRCLYN